MSSILSRQTGQVGSSTRFGVGGGKGLRLFCNGAGVKGSWDSSGKLEFGFEAGVWKVIDFMNITWQVSGCAKYRQLEIGLSWVKVKTYLHTIKDFTVPLSLPPPRYMPISELHEDHIPV